MIGGHLADWITLFEHGQKDNTMQNVEYAPVQQALDRLKGLSADSETRGIQYEARTILERLLSKRFAALGEQTHSSLQNATLEQLNHWADRILDAPTLSAVFDCH